MRNSLATKIIPYSPELAHHFKSINEEWISQMFRLEESDSKVLDDPEAHIINAGGQVIFAEHPTLGIVGTCALLKRNESTYELTKMGVLKIAQGEKIGEQLLKHILEISRQMQIEKLFLLTSNKCQAAIHLYLKHGFVHDAEILAEYGPIYQRSDVAMRYAER